MVYPQQGLSKEPRGFASAGQLLVFCLTGLQTTLLRAPHVGSLVASWCRQDSPKVEVAFGEGTPLTSNQFLLLNALVQQLVASQQGDCWACAGQLLGTLTKGELIELRDALSKSPHVRMDAGLEHWQALLESEISKRGELVDEESVASNASVGDASSWPTQGELDDADFSGVAEPGSRQISATTTSRRFEILETLARGGLGIVSLAYDRELQREVALKRIRSDKCHHETLRRKFMLEAVITGGLQHPGIPPVYALGLDPGGLPFYAMRLIRGEQLKQRIEAFHALVRSGETPFQGEELQQLLRRFIDVCDTIGFAHSRSVIHRDLKPTNVMLGAFGETVVVDWGLAKILGGSGDVSEKTHMQRAEIEEANLGGEAGGSRGEAFPIDQNAAGGLVGTLAYASPEQMAGIHEEVGERSDVYGLGAILYEILTNRPPHCGKTKGEWLASTLSTGVVPPRQLISAVPKGLQAIVLKALAVAPDDRYQSAISLRKDVENWLEARPITVAGEPLREQARRWTRANPTIVASVLLGGLMGIIMLMSLLVLGEQNRKTLAEKNDELRRANLSSGVALEQARASEVAARQQTELAFDSALFAVRELRTLLDKMPPHGERRKELLLESIPSLRAFSEAFQEQNTGSIEAAYVHVELGRLLLHVVNPIRISHMEFGALPVSEELHPALFAATELFDSAQRSIDEAMEREGETPTLMEAYQAALQGRVEAFQKLGRADEASRASKHLLRVIESDVSFEEVMSLSGGLVPTIPAEYFENQDGRQRDLFSGKRLFPWEHVYAKAGRLLLAYRLAAETCLASGELGSAAEAAERCLELHQGFAELRLSDESYAVAVTAARTVLAKCAERGGDLETALQHYEDAVRALDAVVDAYGSQRKYIFEHMQLLSGLAAVSQRLMQFGRMRTAAKSLAQDATWAVERRGLDPRGASHLALAHAMLAHEEVERGGDLETALLHYRNAQQVFSATEDKAESHQRFRFARVFTAEKLCEVGTLLGELDDAIEFGEEAVATGWEMRELVLTYPVSDRVLSRSQASLAAAYLAAGRLESAQDLMSASMRAERRFARRTPKSRQSYRHAAANAIQMGEILIAQQEHEAAAVWISDGLGLTQHLIARARIDEQAQSSESFVVKPSMSSGVTSDDAPYAPDLQAHARANFAVATLHRNEGRLDEAIAAQHAAIGSLRDVLQIASENAAVELAICSRLCDLAEMLSQVGRHREALDSAVEAQTQVQGLMNQGKYGVTSEATQKRATELRRRLGSSEGVE